jgi:hypothetical protein
MPETRKILKIMCYHSLEGTNRNGRCTCRLRFECGLILLDNGPNLGTNVDDLVNHDDSILGAVFNSI